MRDDGEFALHQSQLYTCDHGGAMVCFKPKLLCLFVCILMLKMRSENAPRPVGQVYNPLPLGAVLLF